MYACSCGPRAAQPASRKVPHDSAARLLPHGHSVPGARQTFMHPHTLSHTEPICIQVQEHTSTQQWHVNRHSQYTSKITPNSEAVKMKSSYMADSGSVFLPAAEGLIRKHTCRVRKHKYTRPCIRSCATCIIHSSHSLITYCNCTEKFVWNHIQHQLQLHFRAM